MKHLLLTLLTVCSVFGADQNLRIYTNIADMLANASPRGANLGATTLGYSVQNDGGGGVFVFSPLSSAATNLGTVFRSSLSSTGRWVRLHDGAIQSKWFNAKGDNTTDDTAALQSWADASEGYEAILTPGTYELSSFITFHDNTVFSGLGQARLRQTVANLPIFHNKDTGVSDVTFQGLEFEGTGTFVDAVNTNSELRGEVGIWVQNNVTNFPSKRIYVRNCKFFDFGASGVFIQGAECVEVMHNYFEGTTPSYDQILQFGVYLPGAVQNYTVKYNDITLVANGIFAGHGGTGADISENKIYDITGQHGIYGNAVYSGTISRNHIRNTARAGLKAQLSSAAVVWGAPYVLHMDENTITDTGGDSLLILNAQPGSNSNMTWTNWTAHGNLIQGTGTLAPLGDRTNVYSIYIDHSSHGSVRGNQIIDRYRGIRLVDSFNVSIEDTLFKGIYREAIYESTSTNLFYERNKTYDSRYAFAWYITSDTAQSLKDNEFNGSSTNTQYSIYFETGVTGASKKLTGNVWDKPIRLTGTTSLELYHENYGTIAGFPSGKIQGRKLKVFSSDTVPASLAAGEIAWMDSPSVFGGWMGNNFGTVTEYGLMNNATAFCWDAVNKTFAVGTSAGTNPSIPFEVQRDTNALMRMVIENATSGTAAAAAISFIANNVQAEVGNFSPLHATAGLASRHGVVVDSGNGGVDWLGVGMDKRHYVNGSGVWMWDLNSLRIFNSSRLTLEALTNVLLRADGNGGVTNALIGTGLSFDGTTLSASAVAAVTETNDITFPITDTVSTITTGVAKQYWDFTHTATIKSIRATVGTQSTSGGLRFDVKKNGVTVFSTTPTIDANELSTATAATNSVLSTTAVALNDRMTFDINEAGLGAKNAQITIYFTAP